VDRRTETALALVRLLRGAADAIEAQAESEPAPTARLLRYREAAVRLACNRSTVGRLAEQRALDVVMVGSGSPRVTSESVDALIARGGVRAARRRRPSLLAEVSRGGKA
jgi:excisionase family DNA binding protein